MKLLLSLFSSITYAQDSIVGTINTTLYNTSYGNIDTEGKGLALFISNVLRLFFVVAGILALFNFVLAGFQYMTSGGDSKKMEQAWSRIWLSLVGLLLMVGSFAIAGLFGWLLFKDPLFMLRPTIYGPN